jgi:hypothetical protein
MISGMISGIFRRTSLIVHAFVCFASLCSSMALAELGNQTVKPESIDQNQPQDARPTTEEPELKVGNIPADKRDKIKSRVESLHFTTFGLGPAWMPGNDHVFYALNYGYNWDVSEHGEIRAGAFGIFPSEGEGFYTGLGIGGSYFFSADNLSPIIGGQFGLGSSKSGDLTYSGFAYEAHAGLRFFRTSTTQLSIEIFYLNIAKTGAPGVSGINLNIHY